MPRHDAKTMKWQHIQRFDQQISGNHDHHHHRHHFQHGHHDVHDHHYKHDLRPFLPSRPGRVGLGRAGKPTGSDLVGSDRSVRVAWVRNHFGSSAHGLHIGLNSHRHRWLRPRLRVQGTEPPQSVAIQSLTLARWEHHPIGNDCPRQPFNKPFLDTQRVVSSR